MLQRINSLLLACLVSLATGLPVALSQPPSAPPARSEADSKENKKNSKEKRQQREESLRGIAVHLGVAHGSVIADIGAGDGRDTWVFADIVGENGKVFAQEIDEEKMDALRENVEKRSLPQVEVVLGTTADPCLSADSLDMAFMHFVYHHVTKPQEMLRGIWRALKPGGYLVIVDQRLGTLTDWVPREDRGKKHYWIAETTVVREAREQGFRYVEYADSFWHVKDSFVLVFQRPHDLKAPGQDPDLPLPLPECTVACLVPSRCQSCERIAFVALDKGRKLMAPILEAVGGQAVDIVLEEWATRKDERPPSPTDLALSSVLTEKGDPRLGPEPLDAVYFLDSYHRLFHGSALLAQLHERLTCQGRVYIVDRRAVCVIPHRDASHRRMIAVETVKQEMADANFCLCREGAPPTPDRFLLEFMKVDLAVPPKADSLGSGSFEK